MKKRTEEVLLWLTEKEKMKLKTNAKKSGLTVQAYLRKLLDGIQPKELPPADFYEVLKTLRQISINMNQVAIKANMTGAINADAYWENSKRLQEVIGEIKTIMFEAGKEN